MSPQDVTDKDLSGPVIDRRTTLKLLGTSSTVALAGCGGGGSPATEQTATQQTATDTEVQSTDTATPTPTPASTSTPSMKTGGTLNAGWAFDEINNMDPVTNSVASNEQATQLVFNALTVTTPKLKIKGEIAKDWTVKNKTDYTFELREGLQFHGDYGEVTAEDVKFTLMRGLTAKGSTSKPKLKVIKKPWKENIVVKDKYTLKIKLNKPFVPFIKSALSRGGGACNVHPKQAIEEIGDQFKVKPIGSGPFKVKAHTVGSKLTLEKFEDYWKTDPNGVGLPYLDGINIKPLAKTATLINGLLGADLDYVHSIPLNKVGRIKSSGKINAHSGPAGGWIGIYFNMAQERFQNVKVRQGITRLVNQKEFSKRAHFGNSMPAIGPLSPVHSNVYRPKPKKPDTQNFNPEKGKQLLREAGYSSSNPLQFGIMSLKSLSRGLKTIKRQLDDYDILDLKLNAYGASTAVKRLQAKKGNYYDTALWGSDVDLSPDTTMYFFFVNPEKGGAYNNMGYKDKEVTQWLQKQRKVFDIEKRAELFHKAEDKIMKEAPVAFLYHSKPWIASRKLVQNAIVHPFRRPLERTWLKQ